MSKTTEQRRKDIFQIIVTQGSIKVGELSKMMNVTTETIRKDLNIMDEQGIITKTHGGAEIKNDYYQLPLDVKINEHAYEKQLIARTALNYIKDNSIIYLDPGSTTLNLAKYLRLKKGLTVVTNSLAIAQVIANSNNDLIIVGGKLQKQGNASIGAFASNIIDALKIDIAFMGTDGFLNALGPSTFSHEEMEVKQHVISRSTIKVLLCDSSKFKKASTYTFAKFSDYDVMITNELSTTEKEMVKDVHKLVIVSNDSNCLIHSNQK